MSGAIRRHPLSSKEIKRLLADFSKIITIDTERLFGSRPQIEIFKVQRCEIFIVKGIPLLVKLEGELLPTLLFREALFFLPKVVVDMGAVPHVCNGADIMAPGIVKIEGDFNKGDLVLVVDERHGKPIALGRAFLDSNLAKMLRKGRTVENIHYVGDEVWNIMKKFIRNKGAKTL